jgi:hypothetical protein
MEETGVPGENHRPVAGHPFPTLSKKTCINLIKNNIIFGVFHSPKRNNIPLGAIFVKHFPTAYHSEPATGRWFSPGPPVSSINKTDRHDITEIVLKVALYTILIST